MKTVVSLLVIAVAVLLAAQASGGRVKKVTAPACSYRSYGALPDATCTPGALNSAVTQATIGSTICVVGYTSTIRPPASVTEPEKVAAIQQYGAKYGTNLRSYEYDHLVPLEVGGAPNASKNMWPKPGATLGGHGSYDKDVIENKLHDEVCSGKMTLAAAQKIFMTDWRKG